MEHPEFDVLGTMSVTLTKDEGGKSVRHFRVVASSTVEDSHGDSISERAIQSMADTANKAPLTIFLNHEYKVPEDVFGTVTKAFIQSKSEGGIFIKDLILEGDVNEANPRAAQTADLVANGARLGTSIGAKVKDYKPKSAKDPMGAWLIDDVELREASIVGMPANPRTWVEYATKAIRRFEREKVKEAADNMKKNADIATVDEDVDVAKIATTDDFFNVPDANEPDSDEPEDGSKAEAEATINEDVEAEAAEAPVEEPAPEESPDTDKTASENTAEALLSKAIDTSAEALTRTAMREALTIAKDELHRRSDRIDQLTEERDAALATLATATAIVNKIANMPIGRKATFKAATDDYRTRVGHVYAPEVMKFLKGPEAK